MTALRVELEALKSDLCAANEKCQALEATAEGRSVMLKDQALSSDGYEEELADRVKERCVRLLESLLAVGVVVDGDPEDPIGLLDDGVTKVCEERGRLVAEMATSAKKEGELRREVELLTAEVEATRGKLDDALAMQGQLEARCKSDESELEELSGTLEALLLSLSSKVKELEKMVSEDGCVDKERIVAKMEELKKEKMTLDDVVEQLRGDNERLSKELEGLREQLSTLEAQLGEASRELESKSAELSAASGKADASEVLEAENANLKAMLSALQEELEERRAAVEAASKRLEQVENERSALQSQLEDSAARELESKSAELSAASGKADASEVLEAENANLKAMLSALQEELGERRAAVEAASKRLEQVENERSALQSQLEDSAARLVQAEEQSGALEEGRRSAEESVECLRGDNERLLKESEGLREQLSTLEAQLGEASRELESKSAELSAASGKADASEVLEAENANLKAMLAGLQAELEESRAAVEAASKRLEEVEGERSALRDELASIPSTPMVVAKEAVTLAAEPLISPVETVTVQAVGSAPEASAEMSLTDWMSVMSAVKELNASLGVEVETQAGERPTALLLEDQLQSACVKVQEMQHAWKDEAARSAEEMTALRVELEALKSDLCAANEKCQALEATAEGRSVMLKDQALSSDGYEEELADRVKERCVRLLESLLAVGVVVDGDPEDPIGLLDDGVTKVCEERGRLVAEMATSAKKEGELRREVELLTAEVEATRGKLDDALAMQGQLEARCKSDESELEELSGTLEALLLSLSSKVKELEKMVSEDGCVDKERIVAKMEELKKEKMTLDDVVEQLRGDNERLSKELEGLREQLSTLEAQLGEASRELESKSAELSAASGKADASEVLEAENANLKAMLSALQEELEERRAAVEAASKRLEQESRAAVEAASKRLEEVEGERSALRDELASIPSTPMVVAKEAVTLAAEPLISPVETVTVQAVGSAPPASEDVSLTEFLNVSSASNILTSSPPLESGNSLSDRSNSGFLHGHSVRGLVRPTLSTPVNSLVSAASDFLADSQGCACPSGTSVSSVHADFCPLALPSFYRLLLSKLFLFVSFADGCLRLLNIPVDILAFPFMTCSFDACASKMASLLKDVEFAFHSAVLAASAESLSLHSTSVPSGADLKFPNFTELINAELASSTLEFDRQALLCLSSCLYVQLRRVLFRGFGFDQLKEPTVQEAHPEVEVSETADGPSAGAKRLSESWLSFMHLLKSLHPPSTVDGNGESVLEVDSPVLLSQCLCSLPPQSVQSDILSRLPRGDHSSKPVRALSPVQTLDAASQTPTEMMEFLIGNRGDSFSPETRPQLDPSAFSVQSPQGGFKMKDAREGLSPAGEGIVPFSLRAVPPLSSIQSSWQSAPCLAWSEDGQKPVPIEALRLQALSSLDAFARKLSKYGNAQSSQYGEQFFPLSALSDQIANLRSWLIGTKARSAGAGEEDIKSRTKEEPTREDSARASCETQTCPEQQIEVGICEGEASPESEESTTAAAAADAQPTSEIFLKRLLNIRDTEVLYLLTHLPEAKAFVESGSLNSLPSAEYAEAQLRMLAHWDLVSPVDAKCLPIHRVKIMSTPSEQAKYAGLHAQTDPDKISSSILDDAMKRFQTSHLPPVKHRDYVWLDSDLEAVAKSLLRRCHALLKLIAAPLKGHRGCKCRNQLSKTHVKELHDLSLQLAQIVGCKPLTATAATSPDPLSTETTTAIEDSFPNAEPIRFCLMPEPQGYAQNRPSLPILELVTAINQATSLPDLRSLAEFLIDQYHILQTELEQQLDTNWQLRRRLHVANNKVAEIAQEICANNHRLEVAGQRLHAGAEKSALVHETADGPPPTASRDRLLTTPVRSHRMTRRSEISRLKDQLSASRQPTSSEDSTSQSKPAAVETSERQGEPTPTMHFDIQQNTELSGSPRFSEALTEDSPTSMEAPGDDSSAPHEKTTLSKTELTNGESSSPPAVQLAAHSPSSPAVPSPTPVGESSSDRQQPKKQKSLLKKMAAVFKPSSEGTD
nr:unnamed protein product [Spirometra erinaceieuropaei]